MNARETVAQMTLEEKAGLLSGRDFWHTKAVSRLGVESVMLCDGPHGLRKQAENADHLGLNASVPAVCFPAGCACAASFDRETAQEIGAALGEACRAENVAAVLGPAINIKRSPLCGRNFEYYSEDPYLAGELAAAYIRGVQEKGVSVCVKHFAANSQENRRMSSDSVLDERTLREIYLPAFETAVKQAKPWALMCSYNKIGGVFSSDNPWLLNELLRGEWGFDGCVVSDWGATANRVEGVKAGMDLEMPASGGENDRRIVKAVREGRLPEALVDVCCERVVTLIQRYTAYKGPSVSWDKGAQHALARRLAAKCMVLLKNEGELLPLRATQKIAVIGRFAKHPRFQGGGSSHIHCTQIDCAWDALKALPGAVYADGYAENGADTREELLLEAENAARGADAAIVFAGLPDSYESEGYDRAHMRMPEGHNQLILRVAKANPNTAVVLYNGSPVEMPWIDNVKAVLEAYLGGQAAGGATADILLGRENPSGRLPESFPIKLKDNPSYPWYGGEKDTVEYREGVFVGYRWYDKKEMDVRFPFGYGLSYTTFAYGNLRLSAREISDTDLLAVSVDVTNTGRVAGGEVVQLYVSERSPEVIRPVRELKGFEKLALAPGETRTARFTLSSRAFAYWHAGAHAWRVHTGAFGIQIGRSSRDILLEEDVRVNAAQADREIVTVHTVLGDLMESPKAMRILAPMLEGAARLMGGGESAQSAVTAEMMRAVLRDLPLRALVMLSGGRLTLDQIDEIVRALNQP